MDRNSGDGNASQRYDRRNLESNHLPPGRTFLPGRWVFGTKLGSNGAITRYKARWVVKGFRQVEGVDFDKTFASVVKWALWRALLGLGVKEN